MLYQNNISDSMWAATEQVNEDYISKKTQQSHTGGMILSWWSIASSEKS
jgi:hypothetical protein